MPKLKLPYPPVFSDWRRHATIVARRVDARVATGVTATGVDVQMMNPGEGPGVWHHCELTEEDAALMAASLLRCAGYKKLSKKVLKGLSS